MVHSANTAMVAGGQPAAVAETSRDSSIDLKGPMCKVQSESINLSRPPIPYTRPQITRKEEGRERARDRGQERKREGREGRQKESNGEREKSEAGMEREAEGMQQISGCSRGPDRPE